MHGRPVVIRAPCVAGFLFLSLLLSACGRREPERWNVLLVLVDTLRADRMSLYGYRRPTTPNLEALDGMVRLLARANGQEL